MRLNPIQKDNNKPAFKAQLILKNNIRFSQPHYRNLKSYVSNIGEKSDTVTIEKDKINITLNGNKKEAKLDIFKLKTNERVEKIKETIDGLLTTAPAATVATIATIESKKEKSIKGKKPNIENKQKTPNPATQNLKKITAPIITKEDLAKIQLTPDKGSRDDNGLKYFIMNNSKLLTDYEPQIPFVEFMPDKSFVRLNNGLKNLTPNSFEIKLKNNTQVYKVENGYFNHPELDKISQFEDVEVYYFDNNKLAIRASNKNMQPILAKDLKGNRNIVFPYKDYEIPLTEGSKIIMAGAYNNNYSAELKYNEDGQPTAMIVKLKDEKGYGDIKAFYNSKSNRLEHFICERVDLKHPYFNKVIHYMDGDSILSLLQINNIDGNPSHTKGTYKGKKSLETTLDFIKENEKGLLNFKTIKDSDIEIKPSSFNSDIHNLWPEILDNKLPSTIALIRGLDKIKGGYAYNLRKQGIVKEEYVMRHRGYEAGMAWVFNRDIGVVYPVNWKGEIANIDGFDYDRKNGTISFNKGNKKFICAEKHNASRLNNYGGAAIVEEKFVKNGLNVNVKQEVLNNDWATLTETHKNDNGEIVAFCFTALKRINPDAYNLKFTPIETIRKEINSDDIIIKTENFDDIKVSKEMLNNYDELNATICKTLIKRLGK